jgi:hypothetical protein
MWYYQRCCYLCLIPWLGIRRQMSAVKEGQQKHCETAYSRSGINHMWILKNSKDLLDNLKSRSFSQAWTKLVCMWYYQRCCYLCLIPWLGIRSNTIYIQTRCCWKPCPQERKHICHEERKDTWYLSINMSLRKVIFHGSKFREPQHINWKHNFKIIMDAVEDYARRWIKREVDQDPELCLKRSWMICG